MIVVDGGLLVGAAKGRSLASRAPGRWLGPTAGSLSRPGPIFAHLNQQRRCGRSEEPLVLNGPTRGWMGGWVGGLHVPTATEA